MRTISIENTEIWNKIWEEGRLAKMPFSNRGGNSDQDRAQPIFEKPIIVRFKHVGNISQGPIMPEVVRNWSCREFNGETHSQRTMSLDFLIMVNTMRTTLWRPKSGFWDFLLFLVCGIFSQIAGDWSPVKEFLMGTKHHWRCRCYCR